MVGLHVCFLCRCPSRAIEAIPTECGLRDHAFDDAVIEGVIVHIDGNDGSRMAWRTGSSILRVGPNLIAFCEPQAFQNRYDLTRLKRRVFSLPHTYLSTAASPRYTHCCLRNEQLISRMLRKRLDTGLHLSLQVKPSIERGASGTEKRVIGHRILRR